MTPDLRMFVDPAAAAEACAAHILQLLQSALMGSQQASLAISGGSTPKLMFAAMAKAGFDWKNVHLFWVDERAVPPDHEQSNYRLADEWLIRPAKIRHVHRIPAELTPGQAAKRYSTDIREHFQVNEGELPHLDVVHLGIGPDAHTASLFPGEPLINDRQGLAAAVYVEKIPQWRITLLPGVLLAARNMVILAAGGDKKEALESILHGPYDPIRYPAQIVARQARRPIFFLDQAATDNAALA
jgi:6-phosphogluconolactonase